ncbi:MAG TPA: hypothetical protein DHW63_07745 [Hyphomonadaceae bacterium]|nr:hypothetical protein [Hyphomonadaceae bacterium]
MNDAELLWKMYEDNRVQAQLHEDRRASATALIAGGAGALVTAIVSEGIAKDDAPLAAMVIIMGIFGWLIAVKATERMRLHNSRCYMFLDELDRLDREVDIVALKQACDQKHRRKHWITHRFALSWLWQSLHVLIAAAGVVFLLRADPFFFTTTFEGVREAVARLQG